MQTLEQALFSPRIRAALAGYHGVAAQPGARIDQCRTDLIGAIPLRSERGYSVEQLKERALTVVGGIYQSRTDLPRLPDPETAADVLEQTHRAQEQAIRPGYHAPGKVRS